MQNINSYITMLFLSGVALSACSFENPQQTLRASMYEPTKFTERKAAVEKNYFTEKKEVDEIDYEYLTNFVQTYNYDGSSPIYAIFTYDPDKRNGKLNAFNKSNVVKGQLAKLGAKNTIIKTLPVKSTEHMQVIMGYDKLSARGPKECDNFILGSDDSYYMETDYTLGCSIKNARAGQVAYPADLLGQDNMSAYNAKRSGMPVQRDPYSGEISEFIPSYILSEVGN